MPTYVPGTWEAKVGRMQGQASLCIKTAPTDPISKIKITEDSDLLWLCVCTQTHWILTSVNCHFEATKDATFLPLEAGRWYIS